MSDCVDMNCFSFPRLSVFTFSPHIALGQLVTPELLSRIDAALTLFEDIWFMVRTDLRYVLLFLGIGSSCLVFYAVERFVRSQGK